MTEQMTVKDWAMLLHAAYEAAAHEASWKTQESCRDKMWEDLPAANKHTMLRMVERGIMPIYTGLRTQLAARDAENKTLREDRNRLNWIEEGLDPADIDFGGIDGKWLVQSSDGTGFESDCFRDAVDCAMRQDRKREEGEGEEDLCQCGHARGDHCGSCAAVDGVAGNPHSCECGGFADGESIAERASVAESYVANKWKRKRSGEG